MSNLIPVFDLPFNKKKTFDKDSPYLKEAIKRLRNKRKVTEEQFEDVIDLFELLDELGQVAEDFDNYRGSHNESK